MSAKAMRILLIGDDPSDGRSVREALANALKGNPGFRAVSIFPTLKDGHPVAEVSLAKGEEWKSVSEKLD